MPSSPNKGYTQPAFNTEVGTWGTDINANLTGILDLNLGGIANVALSSTNVTLTTGASGQIQNAIISLSGTLLASVTVSSAAIGFYIVENLTTGNFLVTWQANFGAGAVGPATIIPQGNRVLMVSDTTNGARAVSVIGGGIPTGTMQYFGGSAAPSGWVLCFGQAISRTLFSGLFSVIGTSFGVGDGSTTFNLPDVRGRTLFGLDNMGGSAAGRLTGSATGNIPSPTTMGSAGGEENHGLTGAEGPSHAHGTTITDPGHSHTDLCGLQTVRIPGSSFTTGSGVQSTPGTTGTSTTGIGVTVNSSGSGTAHNTTPPGMTVNVIIKT